MTHPVNVRASFSDVPFWIILVSTSFNLHESCVFVLVSKTFKKIKYFDSSLGQNGNVTLSRFFYIFFLFDCWYFDSNLPRLNPVKTPLAYNLLGAGAIFDILQQKWRISINAKFFWYLIYMIEQTSVNAKMIFYKIFVAFWFHSRIF